MTKRKINVEKLSEEQFINAQKKISEKITFETNQLLEKWRPEFKNFGRALDVEVEVGEEKDVKIMKSASDLSEFHDDCQLGSVAKELDRISYGMSEDLEIAVNSCNQLLNRYGMSCNMAFTSKVISD